MSLILDALQRSEQDQANSTQSPGLSTRHALPIERSLFPALVWGGLALVVVGLLVSLMFFQEQQTSTVQSVDESLSGEMERLPVAADSLAPEPLPSVAPLNQNTQVASLYAMAKPIQSDSVAATSPATSQAAVISEATVISEAVTPVLPEAVPTSAEQEILDIEALARAAEVELAVSDVAPHPVPLIAELPQSAKDKIPTIFFRKHDWSSLPSQSHVQLNGEMYREGETVAAGLTLLEILSDSIVLDYHGKKFRLRALNSWVNL
jgi:general secretion pathway protein B